MDQDVLVVGGGPGGATASHSLARAGFKVLLLEKATFPRHKPCGGSLSPKVLSLGLNLKGVVEDVVEEVLFTSPGEEPIRYRSPKPLAYMVQRERFDHLLLHYAQDAGVRVLYGHRILKAREIPGGVEVIADRRSFRAPLLVGADGANGVVTRSFHISPSRIALAMDAEVSPPQRVQEAWRGRALIDFGSIPFGYGWVFPKARDLSTGVLGVKGRVRTLPGYLQGFLQKQLPQGGESRVTGWPIPLPSWRLNPVASPRVLLVGDAAGLVDPFTGEGIYYAMRSGLLASQAIVEGEEGAAKRYRRLVQAEFQSDFRGAAILGGMLHRAPTFWFRALKKHPGAVEAFTAVLAGELSYPAFLRKVARHALSLLGKRWERIGGEVSHV